jgi:CHAD domain-containing protein
MAFRIDNDEDLPRALARVIVEQCVAARGHLARRGADLHEGIHDARRAIRRARAAQALLRPRLGRGEWARTSADLREAGRVLSPLRDAQSLIEAIEEHLEQAGVALDAPARRNLLAALRRRRDRIVGAGAAAISQADAALARAAATAGADAAGFDAAGLAAGLALGRARLARAVRAARAAGVDADALHRVRQRARAHWLQIELLVPAWPAMLATLASEAKKLSQALGEERDLQMLDAWLARRRAELPGSRGVAQVRADIARLREALRVRGLRQAARLCAESPRRFGRNLAMLRGLAVEAAAEGGPAVAQGAGSGRRRK